MDLLKIVQVARTAFDSRVMPAVNSGNHQRAQIEVFNICIYLGSRAREVAEYDSCAKCLSAANSIADDFRAHRRTSAGSYEAFEAYLGQLELSASRASPSQL